MNTADHEAADTLERVMRYHERTKHHLDRYARSLGYLDWATQPEPFRSFKGASVVRLAHPAITDQPAYDELFESAKGEPPVLLAVESLSRFFYDSLALSAWKQAPGTGRWSLRVNPSSGDLHPTEAYLVVGPVAGLGEHAAVYHYSPLLHALERRMKLRRTEWEALAGQLPPGGFLVALTSIYWRESWKYGERAFRYCHHDVGHAIGAIAIAAATLGWQVQLLEGITDRDLNTLLGIDRQSGPEAEHGDCLLVIFPKSSRTDDARIPFHVSATFLDRLANTELAGQPNRLSESHHPWPVIDEVAAATRYGERETVQAQGRRESKGIADDPVSVLPKRTVSARELIRTRRSAVAMDGKTAIERETFFHMLARVSPLAFPFRVLPWAPRVSLALFVHRVSGLNPGLYVLVRDHAHELSLRNAMPLELDWQKPEGCPDWLSLHLLKAADARESAQIISCHQSIAADGAFALGMLAEFEPSLRKHGPWFYPRLFWETGLIGQVLYLEAEAAGIRATGIGCFFDDAMHQVLGLQGRRWQSLYHFTVGGAVEDSRLQTIPAYFHLGVEGG